MSLERILISAMLVLFLTNCGTGNNSSETSSSSESSESSLSVSSSSISSSSSSEPVAAQPRCSDSLAEENKETVYNALDGLFIQKNVSAIDQYWADPYLQHNPIATSGVAAFRSIMGSFVTSPSFNYEIIRIFAECDLVVVLGRYSQTGLIYDMFRVDDGKLIEHWDSDGGQSSNTEGPTEVEDLASTHENRETIEALFEDGLIANDSNTIESYFAEDALIRRNSQYGGAAFIDHLNSNSIRYQEVHHLIADGNFVFVMSEATLNGRAYAIYDVFRLEDGEIVEHWDSRRVVPNSTASGLEIF